MNTRVACSLLTCVLALPAHAGESNRTTITFEERVAAQKAIEQVYWNHRIWPKENPTPKPPLSTVLSAAELRAKVEAYLEESNALDEVWHRPISASSLQAELNRMAKSSRDPGMLRELFAALENDPLLIAETLARQTLADRLVRGWYAHDDRFHGDVKRRAEAALASCTDAGCMKSMGGRYTETTWRRGAGSEGPRVDRENGDRIVSLDAETWKSHLDRLARSLGGSADALPTGKLGRLQETAERFSVTAVLAESPDTLTTASVVWDKEPFDGWWSSAGGTFGTAIDVPRGEYSLRAPAAEGCTFDTWADTAHEVEPRGGHTSVWTGSEMIVWGGTSDAGYLDSGGRYNPSTDTWMTTSRGANAPGVRFGQTAVWTGTEMIVWGGANDDQQSFNSGGRYDPSTDSWLPTSIAAGVPTARRSHSAVWTGSEMIVWGGSYYASGGSVFLSTGGRYDPRSDTWEPVSLGAGVPAARYFHTAVWTGSEMIVWGGVNNTQAFDSGGRYDPSTDTWQPTSTGANTPTGVYGHTAVWTGTRMIVWGGSPWSTLVNTGGLYDPSTDTWQATSTGANAPQGRIAHTAVWTGTEMIVWGGSDDAGSFDSGGRYNPSTDTWMTTSRGANAPAARDGHTAVWTGSEMIVWGGEAADWATHLHSGGRYAPSTNSWLATSVPTGGQPAERDLHTAVWTGTEMIVWGGEFSDWSPLGTGGRYTPVTDSWLPTAAGGSAPSPRFYHTAVWTGTQMIVWGGDGAGGHLNSGGRYNPSNDGWHATARDGSVPTPRSYHTAVWTGTEMIVWGGLGTGYSNTGGRYDPTANSWTATTTVGAPSARYEHTAVWTGAEMIVWGGEASGFTNSGGRYSPSADSWIATSQGADAPEARKWHTAVWTGTRMIVWGGNVASYTSTNTGGRYDPVGDSWATTSISDDTPSARNGHSAVWTGTEMIVWGGFLYDTGSHYFDTGSHYFDTGSHYFPSSDFWMATSRAGAPTPRNLHSAVWTGNEMIVWGGAHGGDEMSVNVLASGGRYCGSCASPATLYRDADSDGYGNSGVSQAMCANPAGWAALAGDCDDTNPAVHPGAPEVCNGVDDDCDLAVDDGIPAPSGSPSITATKSGYIDYFWWTSVSDTTGFDIVAGELTLLRASVGDFTSSTTRCLGNDQASVWGADPDIPAPGGGFWHLVRAVNSCSGNGSYDDGGHQQGSRDPGIDAAAEACP